ncbi:MAG: hypothetical protein WAS00_02995 [Limnochordia bacterium]|jgi:hypothetical protein
MFLIQKTPELPGAVVPPAGISTPTPNYFSITLSMKRSGYMSKYERLIIYPLLFLALFSALTGVNIVSATQQVWDRIVAREVVIVNDEGQEVAVLKYDQEKENPSLELFNNAGHRVVSLLAYADGGAVGIFNQDGHLTAAIQNEENAGALLIYNGTREMKKLVGLRAGLYGGVVEINNAQGLPTGIMGNNAANNGYIGLFKGELLGFLHPQIMLNVGEDGPTIQTAK